MIETNNMTPLSESDLLDLAQRSYGKIDHIYLHWSAGHYGQAYEDYHICIDQDGKIYAMCDNLTEVKAHTWHRNTGAIGVALLCCQGGIANNGQDADYGEEPPTGAQVESMAKCIAILCKGLELPINNDTVMTHCEAAFQDGYGPGSGDPETRWDLWYLPQSGNMQGGDFIRGKAIYYAQRE